MLAFGISTRAANQETALLQACSNLRTENIAAVTGCTVAYGPTRKNPLCFAGLSLASSVGEDGSSWSALCFSTFRNVTAGKERHSCSGVVLQ